MMLIDSSHPEQTRVVVTDKGRVVEFDVEAATKKQTVGNIYLAKITRVEPSLQAAFVEYGAGRQGFLPFSEIHPDYYQIPKEDRQRLLEEEAAYLEAQAKKQEEDDEKYINSSRGKGRKRRQNKNEAEEAILEEDVQEGDNSFIEATDIVSDDDAENDETQNHDDGLDVPTRTVDVSEEAEDIPDFVIESRETVTPQAEEKPKEEKEEFKPRRPRYKRYKIQEVIKKRQILLIQVVKGERGNKGASLTTYLSLAGRYCVLMPNTAHGGGISRKITQVKDRQNLKQIVNELDVPKGMGLIVRTAGANRTKVELKRDYEYLTRMWDNVRELTMNSNAPSLVYEEGSLVKRAIRDIYSKDIPKVLVQGDIAYKEAREFMRLMTPSHMRNIQHYKDPLPLFSRYQIERQLEEIADQVVQLKSGGYLVINQTEALVAIDINSGRSTNEFSVEDTALKTNLEAADEIARQLRLRDLAGLVVIDFIDMEDYRNVRAVERRMKDAVKQDRARIQLARISMFGLMEMTRQRLRPAMQDILSNVCPHCKGAGYIVSVESGALRIIRRIFEEIASHKPKSLTAKAEMNIANFILNKKRAMLARFEDMFDVEIIIEGSSALIPTEYEITTIERSVENGDKEVIISTQKDIPEIEEDKGSEEEAQQEQPRKRSKRRRRGRDNDSSEEAQNNENTSKEEEGSVASSKKGRRDKKRDRDDRKKGQGRRGPRGRYNNFTSKPEEFTTATGTLVLIENPVSVLEKEEIPASIEEDKYSAEEMVDNVVETVTEVVAEPSPQERLEVTEVEEKAAEDKDVQEAETEATVSKADPSEKEGVQEEKPLKSEPVLEDAMAEGPAISQPSSEPPKPARRGWWRSRFGL